MNERRVSDCSGNPFAEFTKQEIEAENAAPFDRLWAGQGETPKSF
jgi:hypothetical protein